MIAAAFRYFAVVFAVGFLLGTVRVLWVIPALGEFRAVLAELPLILGSSWIVAARIVSPDAPPVRALAIGFVALVMLLAAEVALSILLFGQALEQWLISLARPPGLVGLSGQILFGLIPWLQALRRSPLPAP